MRHELPNRRKEEGPRKTDKAACLCTNLYLDRLQLVLNFYVEIITKILALRNFNVSDKISKIRIVAMFVIFGSKQHSTHNVGHVNLLFTYIHLRNKFHVYSVLALDTKPKAKCNLRPVAMLQLYT